MKLGSAKKVKEKVPPLYTVNTQAQHQKVGETYTRSNKGGPPRRLTLSPPRCINPFNQHIPGLKKGRGGGAPKRTGLPQGTPAQGTKI